MSSPLNLSPLGHKSVYIDHYDPTLLFPIPRKTKRDELNLPSDLPFSGWDIWNAFELSWLTPKGKPMVAIAVFQIPCTSPNIIESKSFKLYLNSFNQSKIEDTHALLDLLNHDLSKATGAPVSIRLYDPDSPDISRIRRPQGVCLDHADITIDQYTVNPEHLFTEPEENTETLYSHLLKSNCLVTGQPDWGTLEIAYTGKKINHEGLLKYIVSFRNHNEFHEQCVERIFMDIMNRCRPTELSVYARYTRRGGLDINPIRTTQAHSTVENHRLSRQ